LETHELYLEERNLENRISDFPVYNVITTEVEEDGEDDANEEAALETLLQSDEERLTIPVVK
jgi:hypothetical protein